MLRITATFVIVLAFCGLACAGDRITLVIIPPAQTATSKETIASALLICDRLAAELAKDPEIRVVDRTQIDRILTERAMEGASKPALSYDALVRVSLDPVREKPVMIVEVVDLSTGNLGGRHEWPWTEDAPIAEIAKACKESASHAMNSAQGKLTVRFLGVSTPGGAVRLDPIRSDFQKMIEQVLEKLPNVCTVQHLEAMTTKQESLLLLLGQTQLPAPRQFAPQADRILSAEVVETDAENKTFENTSIELRIRLGKTGQDGAWQTVRGKVADWEKLAPQACQLIAEQLGQTKPKSAAEFANEMIVRRQQAEAELKAAMPPPNSHRKPDLQRIAAAAKLDPTYDEAAFQIVNSKRITGVFPDEVVPEVIQYLEQFPYSKHRVDVLTGLTFYRVDKPPKDLLQTELNKRIIDIGMGEDIRRYESNCGFLVEPTYRGWLANGGDRAQCNEWLENIRRRIDILIPQVQRAGATVYRSSDEASFLRMRLFWWPRRLNRATRCRLGNACKNTWIAGDGSPNIRKRSRQFAPPSPTWTTRCCWSSSTR